MRVVADIGTTILAACTVIGVALRLRRKRRVESNLEAVQRLEKENEEIDKIVENLHK